MFRLPLDITRMGFIAAGPAEAVTDYATGAAKTDEKGSPLFGMEVLRGCRSRLPDRHRPVGARGDVRNRGRRPGTEAGGPP